MAVAIVLLLAVGGAVLFQGDAFGPPPIEDVRPLQQATGDYVGSAACRKCHADQHATWHASYHRTMTQVAQPDSIQVSLNGVTAEVLGEEYRFTQTEDVIHVNMPDIDTPEEDDRIDRRLLLTTGSHHMHVFWYETDVSRTLSMLPIVYRLDQKKWIPRDAAFLRPSRPPESERGRWNQTCVKCHTTRPQPRFDPVTRTSDTHAAEFGISCEACHGPGRAHVELRSSDSGSSAVDSIVNPMKLSHERSSAVCGQCHSVWIVGFDDLETMWDSGFRYRPGDDFPGTAMRRLVTCCGESDDAEVADFVRSNPGSQERTFWSDGMVRVSGREFNGLVESPCFQRGTMSCFSCHAMHAADHDEAEMREWADDQLRPGMETNEACLQCHDEYRDAISEHTHHATDSSGSQCMNCHMPHTTYGLLKAMRSHTVDSPSVESALSTGRPLSCNLCHLDQTLDWSARHLEEWYDHDVPELPEDVDEASASVMQLLTGDAGQRALVAWAFRWKPAQEASGTDWMAPFLLLTMNDPYAAVRQIAHESLQTLPGYEDFSFDFTDPDRETVLHVELEDWGRAAPRIDHPSVLFDQNGRINGDRLDALLRLQDDRFVDLAE